MSNPRPFRSLTAKQYKNIVYRAGLKCSSSPTANIFVDGMSTSALYTAVPFSTKGAVLPLPIDHAKHTNPVSPPIIFAHPGHDLQDLSFSPHAANVLATVAKDDNLHVFELPLDGVVQKSYGQANVVVNGLTGATSLAFHPTVKGLVAVGCKEFIGIVSVDYDGFGTGVVIDAPVQGRVLLKLPTTAGPGKEIARVKWSYNGEYLIAIGKDGSFYVTDPRKVTDFETPLKSFTSEFGAMKLPHFAAFIGEQVLTEKVMMVVGLGTARRPVYRVCTYNPEANTLKVTVEGELGCSSGQLLAHYDHDSQLFYVCPRSAQGASIFDTTLVSGVNGKNGAIFNPLINIPLPTGTKGMSQVPKTKVNVDESEVINFYSHAGDNVELYSVSVVRKDRGYHPEIYPNTHAGVANLSLDDFMEGKNVNPKEMSLANYGTPAFAPAHTVGSASQSAAAAAAAAPSSGSIVAPEETVVAEPEQHKSAAQLISEQKGYDKSLRTALDSKFARTTFLHTTGVEPGLNKDLYMGYDLRLPKQHIAYGKTLVANNTIWATPLSSTGGSLIYPRLLTNVGRMPVKPNTINGPSPVSALAVSQLNHYQVATASEDGTVRVYNLPNTWKNGELPENITQAAFEFKLGLRIQVLQYHQYIENCIVATGFDPDMKQEILFIFDVTPGTEEELRYQAYPGVVQDRACHIDFSPDGVHIAIANKRSLITIVSMPNGQVKLNISHGTQPKESWGLWYSHEYLVTIGFVRGGERGVTLHKIDWENKTSTVVKEQSFYNNYLLIPYLDITTGVLLLGGLGTANYNVFFISPETAPYIDGLSVFQSRTDVVGMAYLPKAHVDVHNVEVVKSIKLTQQSEVWPVSWRLPRKRKEFFQDDVYSSGAPVLESLLPSSEYFSAVLENEIDENPKSTKFALKYQSLCPSDMIPLSQAPEEELTDRQQKYISMKQKEFQEDKPKGFLGHSSQAEVEQHYIDKMNRVGVEGRWTIKSDRVLDDVSDSEWD